MLNTKSAIKSVFNKCYMTVQPTAANLRAAEEEHHGLLTVLAHANQVVKNNKDTNITQLDKAIKDYYRLLEQK